MARHLTGYSYYSQGYEDGWEKRWPSQDLWAISEKYQDGWLAGNQELIQKSNIYDLWHSLYYGFRDSGLSIYEAFWKTHAALSLVGHPLEVF